jgi:hypothetical protein
MRTAMHGPFFAGLGHGKHHDMMAEPIIPPLELPVISPIFSPEAVNCRFFSDF